MCARQQLPVGAKKLLKKKSRVRRVAGMCRKIGKGRELRKALGLAGSCALLDRYDGAE